MTLEQFLTYAAGTGVSVCVGYVMAFILEAWPGYVEQESQVKRAVAMGVTFAVPLAATVLLYALCGVEITRDSIWSAITNGFTAFFGSQAGHARIQARKRAAA